jgi:hypothetical protein
MRIVKSSLAVSAAALALAGCASHGVANRNRPDEFAVARSQPLVIPPDFSLAPPRAGDPAAQGTDPRQEALQALFGGPAPRSRAETSMLNAAGDEHVALGARSVAGDPNTNVVDKGATTQAIIDAPVGAGRDATVSTPQ